MNYSTAVFLINKNVRAVLATYEAEDTAKRTLFKTLDPTLKAGDFAIVPTDTRHKMTVVKIVETDVDVDFDSPTPVQWIMGKVDRTSYDEMLAQEQQAITVIKSAELRKKRDDLRKAMFADHVETLKALPIAVINGDAPKA
jgi:hypothetical protein